jgi:hypothetical protein
VTATGLSAEIEAFAGKQIVLTLLFSEVIVY